MEQFRNIKQEIKEEISDDNEQYGSLSVIQNVKYEAPDDLDDDFGNYEYIAVSDVHDDSDFQMHLESSPTIKSEPHNISLDEVDDDDGDDDDDDDVHQGHENEVFVDGEPEIFVESTKGIYSKEHASDPLAISANYIVASVSSPPKKILNSTHTPLAPTSIKRLVQRLPPTVEIFEKRRFSIERPKASSSSTPPSPPSLSVIVRKAPPVKELVQKTYSLKHRLAYKTKTSNICPICARSFGNRDEFEIHRRRCFFKCKKCNLICREKSLMRKHYQKCSIQGNYQKIKGSKSDSSKLVVAEKKQNKDSCNICCMKFNSLDELNAHRKQKHFFANSYACHLCTKTFETNIDAVCHLKQDH